MPDMKLQDMKLTDQVTGHENTRNEIAGHEKYRTWICKTWHISYGNRLHYIYRVCISFTF